MTYTDQIERNPLQLPQQQKNTSNNQILLKVIILYWNQTKKQGYFDLVDEMKQEDKKNKQILIQFDRNTFGNQIDWFRLFKSQSIKFNIIVKIQSNQEAIIVKQDKEQMENLIDLFISKRSLSNLKLIKDKVQLFQTKIEVDANIINQKQIQNQRSRELINFKSLGTEKAIESELMQNVINSYKIVNKKLKSLQISGMNINNFLKGLKFVNLKSLNLSNQKIDKETSELINLNILLKQSIKLCRLDLTSLKFQNTDQKELFKGVSLESIKILKFNQNNLDISKLNQINNSIIFPSQNNLKQIELINCFLFGKKLNPILNNKLMNLKVLNLSKNVNMLMRDWCKVTQVVFKLPYFENIIAHECELDDLITKIKDYYIKEVKIKKKLHSVDTTIKRYQLNE